MCDTAVLLHPRKHLRRETRIHLKHIFDLSTTCTITRREIIAQMALMADYVSSELSEAIVHTRRLQTQMSSRTAATTAISTPALRHQPPSRLDHELGDTPTIHLHRSRIRSQYIKVPILSSAPSLAPQVWSICKWLSLPPTVQGQVTDGHYRCRIRRSSRIMHRSASHPSTSIHTPLPTSLPVIARSELASRYRWTRTENTMVERRVRMIR